MRRSVIALLFGALVLTVGPGALAREGDHGNNGAKPEERKHRVMLGGVVTAVSAEGMTVKQLHGDRTATFAFVDETRFGPKKLVADASALRVGDAVFVKGLRNGDALTARFVEVRLQLYRGTVAAVSDGAISVAWKKADEVAKSWMAANEDPETVVAAITEATKVRRKGDGPVTVGDRVELRARPSATDATKLDAVAVVTKAAEKNDPSPETSPEPSATPEGGTT